MISVIGSVPKLSDSEDAPLAGRCIPGATGLKLLDDHPVRTTEDGEPGPDPMMQGLNVQGAGPSYPF